MGKLDTARELAQYIWRKVPDELRQRVIDIDAQVLQEILLCVAQFIDDDRRKHSIAFANDELGDRNNPTSRPEHDGEDDGMAAFLDDLGKLG